MPGPSLVFPRDVFSFPTAVFCFFLVSCLVFLMVSLCCARVLLRFARVVFSFFPRALACNVSAGDLNCAGLTAKEAPGPGEGQGSRDEQCSACVCPALHAVGSAGWISPRSAW